MNDNRRRQVIVNERKLKWIDRFIEPPLCLMLHITEKKDDGRRDGNKNDRKDRNDRNSAKKSSSKSSSSSEKRNGKSEKSSGKGSGKADDKLPSVRQVGYESTYFPLFLPPANEVCEGYAFTRVCHSVHGGSAPLPAGTHHHPPGPDPSWNQTPPGPDTPPGPYLTPSLGPHPPGPDLHNKRAVSILMECILVQNEMTL